MSRYYQREGVVLIANTEFVVTLDISDDETLLADLWIRTPDVGSIGRPFDVGTAYTLGPPVGVKGCETLADYLVREVSESGSRVEDEPTARLFQEDAI